MAEVGSAWMALSAAAAWASGLCSLIEDDGFVFQIPCRTCGMIFAAAS